jgi:hypothetical protein
MADTQSYLLLLQDHVLGWLQLELKPSRHWLSAVELPEIAECVLSTGGMAVAVAK